MLEDLGRSRESERSTIISFSTEGRLSEKEKWGCGGPLVPLSLSHALSLLFRTLVPLALEGGTLSLRVCGGSCYMCACACATETYHDQTK